MSMITIAGDLAPLGRNLPAFASRSFRSLVDLGLCPRDSFVIANLECPLSDSGTAIMKGGPALRVPSSIAGSIKDFGISAVNLANNHIMDYGTVGLNETIEGLSREGIRWFGAGATLLDAVRPLTFESGDTRVTSLGFAEKEYNVSPDGGAGASPLDLSMFGGALGSVPADAFAIVFLHAGNEYFEYPSPWLRDTCRLAVELGANVVVCQHSHCIGCYESYAGGLILYGQGNFVFDSNSKRDDWWLGLLLQLNVVGGALREFEFVPFRQDPGASVVTHLERQSKDKLLSSFEARSKVLLDEKAYLSEWNDFCERNRRNYQGHLFGFDRWTRKANKLLGFCNLVPRRGQMNIGNVLRCQSHLEVLRQLYSREKTCRQRT